MTKTQLRGSRSARTGETHSEPDVFTYFVPKESGCSSIAQYLAPRLQDSTVLTGYGNDHQRTDVYQMTAEAPMISVARDHTLRNVTARFDFHLKIRSSAGSVGADSSLGSQRILDAAEQGLPMLTGRHFTARRQADGRLDLDLVEQATAKRGKVNGTESEVSLNVSTTFDDGEKKT